MPTNVYVKNQVHELQLVTVVAGGLDPARYSVRPGPITFGEDVIYLSFDRSTGIKNKHTYSFTTVFAVGVIQYTMEIQLKGTVFDSNFTVRVTGVSGEVTREAGPLSDIGEASFEIGFTVGGNVSNPSSNVKYKTVNEFRYCLTLKRVAGLVHNDIRIAIEPTTQHFSGDLPLPVFNSAAPPDYVELLDVWGEGRIVTEEKNPIVTGFTEAYNLNHKDQMISNGPNTGRPIPNKISVDRYKNPIFPLGDGRVRYITVIGSEITGDTAKEMYRVLDKKRGAVLLYDPLKEHLNNFNDNKGKLILKPGDPLNPPFDQPTYRPVLIYGFPNVEDKDEL